MKRFILSVIITIAVLYLIIYAIHYFTDFHLMSIAFVVGIVSCVFTYSGSSPLSTKVIDVATRGNAAKQQMDDNFVISPSFLGSILTLLSSFIVLFI
ncbi:hypothetical protein [Alkalibacillus haloalkaliphilus]|uniref:hypothetical protein n=1 Tax=Alkalibacillus haloalkaliphilus TaxID=94136 RepID=UPI00293584CC|nr:hypothetical protein [Alkalibacillus haloalkaliphilus]MDV2581376.1 hypothetical protein [Alkalibacillus haloalkaliphilus]